MKIFFTVFLVVFTLTGFSQDKITLLQGTVLDAEVISQDTLTIKYKFVKNGKVVGDPVALETYRVFSIEDKDGKERVYYHQDTTKGRFHTVNEMRMFVYGEQDADRNHSAWLPMTLSFGGNVAWTILMQSSILSVIGPFGSLAGSSLIGPKVRTKFSRDPKLLKEAPYIEGFKRNAKKKNVLRSLLTGVIGMGVGSGVYNFVIAK